MATILEDLQTKITSLSSTDPVKLFNFAEALFANAGAEFLDSFDVDALFAIAVSGLAFMETREKDGIAVRIYNPSYGVDGWEAPYTVLEINLKDRPFIVDSVRGALKKSRVELNFLLHPIMYSIRREDRSIENISVTDTIQGEAESYEFYLLSHIEDPERQRQLEQHIHEVLVDVALSTDSYTACREQVIKLCERLEELASKTHGELAKDLLEYAAFLTWLDQDNYVFLGYREYDIIEQNGTPYLQVTPGSGLGILSKMQESGYQQPVPLTDIPAGLRERVTGGKLLVVTKTNAESTVHRQARMDYVGLKKLNAQMEVGGEQRFVGLFTSKALSTPVDKIPILRRRLERVLELDKAISGSHDYKEIVSTFNSMPRDELFWREAEELHQDIRNLMGIMRERNVRLTVRPDPLARGLAVMVTMPRDRFNTDVRHKIQTLLSEHLEASHVDYHLAMGEDEQQLRFHFFFNTDLAVDQINVNELEREVISLTRTWRDHVEERLITSYGEIQGKRLAEKYIDALVESYKADTTATVATRDIALLEELSNQAYVIDVVNPAASVYGGGATHVKIYHPERTLVLSDVMPMLENLGVRVLEQISYYAKLAANETRGLDIFRIQTEDNVMLDIRQHGERLKEALFQLLQQEADNDRLNSLVLSAGLSIRQVALLRTYQMYYSQLSPATSRRFINETLLAQPELASLLFKAFDARFNPELDDREARYSHAKEAFHEALDSVSSLAADRTLRGLYNLIEASVRSNYYQHKSHISFKLESAKVTSMPEPRPLYEIGMTGPGVEGTHLRGGKVARGGLRWSDRPDDFRTEVLGLMKTQMTKNAVIVPVGSKGGFVVKNAPNEREAFRNFGREKYKIFIRSLLDITDNVVNGVIVKPERAICYDDQDPYLVVAADKGTATFSDTANAVSAEYNFWLADAFASGGSHGYDHKQEGITARGAWQCVERHFREMGVNVFEEYFSTVGIGDMAGDVFGNGMLHSEKMRLQAAFNHLHIFLDPAPDPEASFAERKRLFELPRSNWEDYNKDLISQGGGVFLRQAKAIELSPEVRAMLGVDDQALSGQEVICAILKMPVDLLWNGGIGTYVKASSERHSEVEDSSNDGVRVDADELRCKIVGEGGNLGFTQRARIEFDLAGGRINTDAIDNSGGVDMSDHEVNIKILLSPLVSTGELSMVQRNRLLEEMTDEVSNLVLKDNYSQSLSLSLAQERSQEDILLFESLQQYLSEHGGLNPQVEDLPGRTDIARRQQTSQGLSRPELAILLAYTKMGVYSRLLETEFPDEPYFQHYLFDYFPQVLEERFPEAITSHQLNREIVATQFTNTVVDLLGMTFVHRTLRDTGARPVEVIRAALLVLEIIGSKTLLTRLFALDYQVPTKVQYLAISDLVAAAEGIVSWTLLSGSSHMSITDFISRYQASLNELTSSLVDYLPPRERANFKQRYDGLKTHGFADDLASEVAALPYVPSAISLIDASHQTQLALATTAEQFYAVGERLQLGWLRDQLRDLDTSNKWEKIAREALIMNIYQVQQNLTVSCLVQQKSLADFLTGHDRVMRRYDVSLKEIRSQDALSLASGDVLTHLLMQMT